MQRLSLMNATRAPSGSGRSATAPAPGRSRWDIAWLGGRSSAPWVVLAVVLTLLVAAGGTLYTYLRPDGLGWGTRTYAITSDREAVLSFDLTKQPSAAASCDVTAEDQAGLTVGRVDAIAFPATPGGPRTVTRTVTVPTSARAVIVQVDTCRIISTG